MVGYCAFRHHPFARLDLETRGKLSQVITLIYVTNRVTLISLDRDIRRYRYNVSPVIVRNRFRIGLELAQITLIFAELFSG